MIDRSDVDGPVFLPIFAALEVALGSKRYHRALERGQAKSLDDALAEVQEALIVRMSEGTNKDSTRDREKFTGER